MLRRGEMPITTKMADMAGGYFVLCMDRTTCCTKYIQRCMCFVLWDENSPPQRIPSTLRTQFSVGTQHFLSLHRPLVPDDRTFAPRPHRFPIALTANQTAVPAALGRSLAFWVGRRLWVPDSEGSGSFGLERLSGPC